MPLPRWNKLPEADREVILDAALDELVERGLQAASLNRIIERAGVSKGAIYYYFADRADLFRTTLQTHLFALLDDLSADARPAEDAEDFWRVVGERMAAAVAWFRGHPQVHQLVLRGVQAQSAGAVDGPGDEVARRVGGTVRRVIAHGQEVGAIRRDLPAGYLLPLMISVARVSDQWLVAEAMADPDGMQGRIELVLDVYRRLASPPGGA